MPCSIDIKFIVQCLNAQNPTKLVKKKLLRLVKIRLFCTLKAFFAGALAAGEWSCQLIGAAGAAGSAVAERTKQISKRP